MDRGVIFSRKQQFDDKHVLFLFINLFYFYINRQCFTSKVVNWWIEWCGLLVDCDVFICCLDSHSDGTHSPQKIHWWARDVMLHFSQTFSHKETNSSTSLMAWAWVNIQLNLELLLGSLAELVFKEKIKKNVTSFHGVNFKVRIDRLECQCFYRL